MEWNRNYDAVVVANGEFPTHEVPLNILHNAKHVICCDGAVREVHNAGIAIEMIVGDGDSIAPDMRQEYADRLCVVSDQETNDLTKAVHWAMARGYHSIAIVGATGKREDHCLGNISLLLQYARSCKVNIFSDYGVFSAVYATADFPSFERQQVSIFNLTPHVAFTAHGLRYPIENRCMRQWWEGTLNESLGSSFRLEFPQGEMLVFQTYEPK